jgi:iron complex transport system substrate-binding protein
MPVSRQTLTLLIVVLLTAAPSTTARATTYPLTLPDALGGSVTITRKPQRIVSLAPNVTEILFAIGAGDRVVGVTRFCSYPPEVKRLPKVGGYTDISIEAVLALSPDFVVVSRGNPKPTLAALSRHGLTILTAINTESLEEVERAILRIGRATDNEEQAKQVCEKMQATLASVQKAVSDVNPRRRIYFGSLAAPYMAAGPTSFIGECIAAAGGDNIAQGIRDAWPTLSIETIIARNPEVILEGFHAETGSSHREQLSKRLRNDPVWSKIAAVREGRVYIMNDDMVHRPGPRLAQAVAEMARLFYPERFPTDGAKKPQ